MKIKKLALFSIVAVLAIVAILFTVSAVNNTNEGDVALDIHSCNITLEESINLIYAVSFENVNAEDIRMLYWNTPLTHKDKYTKETAQYIDEGIETASVKGVTSRIFQNKRIWFKNMTDVVYARACVEVNGVTYYSDVKSYSVLEYIYNKLGITGEASTTPEFLELLPALREFGAKAQLYYKYNVDKLPTHDYSKIEVAGGYLPDGMNSGLYKEGTEVVLRAESITGLPFVKWTDANGDVVGTEETLTVPVGEDNAVYTAERYSLYSVSFVSDGETVSTTENLNLGDKVTAPEVTKDGATFLGWALTEGGEVVYADKAEITVGEDDTFTFYAVWSTETVYGDWVSNGDGTHTKTSTTDPTDTVTENCSGGTATPTQKPICEHCGSPYGSVLEDSKIDEDGNIVTPEIPF